MKGLIPSWRISAPGVLWRWICGPNLLKTVGGIEVGDLDAKVGNFVRSKEAGYPLREFPRFHKETGPFFEKNVWSSEKTVG